MLLPVYSHYLQSPVGLLKIVADARAIQGISFLHDSPDSVEDLLQQAPPIALLAQATEQLTAYFAGQQRTFDLPIAPAGTEFQQRVWAELRRIPFGETVTYATIARRLGDALAVRAVGQATAYNPLVMVIPCHRVIGTGGKLAAFAVSPEQKRWLLAHEGVVAANG